MIEFCGCLNAGNGHVIEVNYTDMNGHDSTAYIDHRDGIGRDKRSDRAVRLMLVDKQWGERP